MFVVCRVLSKTSKPVALIVASFGMGNPITCHDGQTGIERNCFVPRRKIAQGNAERSVGSDALLPGTFRPSRRFTAEGLENGSIFQPIRCLVIARERLCRRPVGT
jgi:hypothetical protein